VEVAVPIPVILVLVFLGVPLKSSMLLVKHEVAQLSIAIWKESESYLIGLALKHHSSEVLETSVATG
jgi:hypothetical protein